MAGNTNQRMQPIVALKALKRLIDNPELTEEVFVIIKAMSGNALEKSFKRFRKTTTGQQILREKRELLHTLEDREYLATLPAGSLGRAYLNFVESENLTADGLVEASQREDYIENPDLRLFADRMRDQHDLWHVMTGYGRDTFGEACLLGFTYAQARNRGIGIIALIGTLKISQEMGAGVNGAVWQAYRDGKNAAWLPQQDWESLLAKPLEEVRQQLRIPTPQRYQDVFHGWQLANA